MAIRWPGVTPGGTRCPIPLVTSDLYPTLLEMAGLPAMPEQHADGMSFAPLLRNPFAKFERGPLFFHYPHYGNQGGFPSSAMREGDYTLIQDLEDGVYELYNLSTDLGQHNNLEQLEEEKVKEMSAALDAWRREVKASPLQKSSKSGAIPPVLW
jgi:arylsulfatase A-like enzyme